MKNPLKILLVGIGGYGLNYVSEVLQHLEQKGLEIAGVVDPIAEASEKYMDLKNMNVPFFDNMEDFYLHNKADLAIISSPIQFHRPQSCLAMENGTHVLCEKPLSGSVQDAMKMIETKNKTGKLLAIGYQWSYSQAILDLKKDILDGRLGKPKRCKTLVCWPRSLSYFERNSWAGKLRDRQGNWIKDSVANNATAHYLHNMFYILGEKIDGSIMPKTVEAELYRANHIETFDSSATRIIAGDNIEIMFLTTHAVNEVVQPKFELEFEEATIVYEGDLEQSLKAIYKNGNIAEYGSINNGVMNKLWATVDAVRGDLQIACGAEAALSQTICIDAMHQSMEPVVLPLELKRFDTVSRTVWVEGLKEAFVKCYEDWALPSEKGFSWASKGKRVVV